MILILSENDDYSTTKVMEYLHYYGEEVMRINKEDTLKADYAINDMNDGSGIDIFIGPKQIKFNQIKSIWFRRGGFYIQKLQEHQILRDKIKIKTTINQHLENEQLTFSQYIYENMFAAGIKMLGDPLHYNTKKLSVLKMAADIGLTIPKTLITNRKEDLVSFIEKHSLVITKSIQDNIHLSLGASKGFGNYTEVIDHLSCNSFPDRFTVSLFQEKLNKRFEIRSFYLDGAFFSAAIFSQSNKKTEIDFRNYDSVNPNRKVPYKLPKLIESKLDELMKQLKLNTGSIDIVFTISNEYVFLEINPVGQYDMVGKLLNYNLDKQIALWLIKS